MGMVWEDVGSEWEKPERYVNLCFFWFWGKVIWGWNMLQHVETCWKKTLNIKIAWNHNFGIWNHNLATVHWAEYIFGQLGNGKPTQYWTVVQGFTGGVEVDFDQPTKPGLLFVWKWVLYVEDYMILTLYDSQSSGTFVVGCCDFKQPLRWPSRWYDWLSIK